MLFGKCEPYGIDLCSGVRTNARLDPNKLATRVAEVEAEDATLFRLGSSYSNPAVTRRSKQLHEEDALLGSRIAR